MGPDRPEDYARVDREKSALASGSSFTSAPHPRTVGAVDVGSNTVKLTVAAMTADGVLHDLHHDAETVRLGAGLEDGRPLDPVRAERAIQTLTRFRDAARAHGAERLVGVATEAIRRALDGRAFLERVERETGWVITTISGQEEARLNFEGLRDLISADHEAVIADIGGGSTELIHCRQGSLVAARSLPVGSGRLSDRLVPTDPPTAESLAACKAEARHTFHNDSGLGALRDSGDGHLLVSGGTGVYLGALVGKVDSIPPNLVLHAMTLMTTLSSAEIAIRLRVSAERARVLPAGVAIVAALHELAGGPEVMVTESGLRRGLLLQEFQRLGNIASW